jgi:serine/threonine-protein kinase
MSPEQLKSARAADARSDIWSLGVILFELLAGTLPWLAETVTQLTAVVLQDPPRPLRELRQDVPPGLVAVVERCLAKDRERRFQSVAELAAALEAFAPPEARDLAARVGRIAARSGGSLVPPPSPSRINVSGGTSVAWSDRTALAPAARRNRWAIGVAGLLAAAVLAAGGLFFFSRSRAVASASAPALAGPTTTTGPPEPQVAPSALLGAVQEPASAAPTDSAQAPATASAPSARPPSKDRPPLDRGGSRGLPAKPKDELPQNRTSW